MDRETLSQFSKKERERLKKLGRDLFSYPYCPACREHTDNMSDNYCFKCGSAVRPDSELRAKEAVKSYKRSVELEERKSLDPVVRAFAKYFDFMDELAKK